MVDEKAPRGFARHAAELAVRGLWRYPRHWSAMTDADRDAALWTHAVALRAADSKHRIWSVCPLLARDVPLTRPPQPPVARRHAIYHIYAARSNDHWRRNVDRMLRHDAAFDGRKIASIAADAATHSFDLAAAPLEAAGYECHEMPNDPQLREVVSFLPLLCWVRPHVAADDAVWYAHTKGNTTADGELGATIWSNMMYDVLLGTSGRGRLAEAMRLLESHTFVGTNKIRWTDGDQCPFPSGLNVGRWMLAGTFYWFRGSVLHGDRWRRVAVDRYGAEAWPSVVCPDHREAATLYQPWPESQYPTPNPYDPATYDDREDFLP